MLGIIIKKKKIFFFMILKNIVEKLRPIAFG